MTAYKGGTLTGQLMGNSMQYWGFGGQSEDFDVHASAFLAGLVGSLELSQAVEALAKLEEAHQHETAPQEGPSSDSGGLG